MEHPCCSKAGLHSIYTIHLIQQPLHLLTGVQCQGGLQLINQQTHKSKVELQTSVLTASVSPLLTLTIYTKAPHIFEVHTDVYNLFKIYWTYLFKKKKKSKCLRRFP